MRAHEARAVLDGILVIVLAPSTVMPIGFELVRLGASTWHAPLQMPLPPATSMPSLITRRMRSVACCLRIAVMTGGCSCMLSIAFVRLTGPP